MKRKIAYFIYRFYKPLVVLLIIVSLNYLDGYLIDLLLGLFKKFLPELNSLIFTLIITLIFSVAFGISVYLLAVRLKHRIFPNKPERPQRKTSPNPNVPSDESEVAAYTANLCRCACGSDPAFSSMLRFTHGDANFTASSSIVKHPDGYGLLRLDAGSPGHYKTCAFRINYCPMCGGHFINQSTKPPKGEYYFEKHTLKAH